MSQEKSKQIAHGIGRLSLTFKGCFKRALDVCPLSVRRTWALRYTTMVNGRWFVALCARSGRKRTAGLAQAVGTDFVERNERSCVCERTRDDELLSRFVAE